MPGLLNGIETIDCLAAHFPIRALGDVLRAGEGGLQLARGRDNRGAAGMVPVEVAEQHDPAKRLVAEQLSRFVSGENLQNLVV